MSAPRRPLGEQALHLIKEAGERCQSIDRTAAREALRARIDQASVRPTPGTSHLLTENKPLADEYHGVDRYGKPGTIKVYDLVGCAPIHWFRPTKATKSTRKGG